MLCRLSLLLLCWALTGLEGLGSDKTPDPSLETTTLADLRKPEKDAPSEAKNAEDSRRGAEPQLPGKHTPLLGKEGGSVPERPAEPLEAEQDNQENIISQLLGDYDKVKTVSSGSDCVCSCVVRPIKRSDCSRITDGDPSSPFYTVETITKGTDCKKCVCMAPPSAVNPCEGEYRFKKLQEASKDDIKLATIMDLLEGSMYGMDLLKLQSVTNKLLSRVDNMEKAFTRNLTERAREKERQKERAKEKEKEKKALQKKKKVVVLERPVPKSGAAANANKKKNYDGPLKKNQQQDGLEQLQSNKTGTEKSVKDKTAPKQPIKDKNSMVIRGVTFYKAAEDGDKEEEEKGRHISRIASDSVDLLIPDHLPPTKPFPTNGPDSSTTLNTKVDFQTKNRPAPTQPPTPHMTTAKQTTTTAKAAPTTIGPVSESTTNIIPTPTKPQTVTLTTTKPTTTKPTTTKPTTQPTTVTITTAKPTTQPTTTKPTTQPTTATMTTAKPTTSTKPIITTTTTTTTTTEPATTTTTTTKPTTGKPTTATTTTRKPTTKSTTTTTTTTTKPTTTTTKPTTKPTTTTTTTKSTTTKLTTSSQQTTTVVLQTTIPAVRLIDASPVEETRPKSRISWTESPADQPKTTKKPTMCKDTVASISEPVQHNTYGLSDGAWMKDARGHGNVIYLTIGQYGNNLQEYRDMDTFKSGQTSNSYKLPYGFTGTGHVVYNGAFYYNRAFSRDVIRYDLRHRYVAAWTTLHDALLEEQVHRTQTEVEFAVDESGLWILYPAVDTEGFHQEVILLVHLNPRDLQPIRSFRTGLRRGRYGNSFLVCGVLYAVNSMEHHYANVTYAFDTHTFTHTVPSLAFTNTHAHTSQLSYCPMDKKLYAWDDGNQMTYDLVFAY